jgi:nucleotide-binding universal stress UspA family protein
MSEVILVVSGPPEGKAGLIAASRQLALLIGDARIRVLILPSSTPTLPTPSPDDVVVEHVAPGASITATVEARGSRSDFIVVARPDPQDDRATRHAFRTAVFQTERPVLMVPATIGTASFGRRVAIAWRDDARAVKAVVPALRFLARAEKVHLLTGIRAGAPTPAIPPVLVERGVRAELHVIAIGAFPFGQNLLDRAHALQADMLIMGAYVHSPVREMLLGGTTRYVVAHADLPVLLRH